MAKRRKATGPYISEHDIEERFDPPSHMDVSLLVPGIVDKLGTSMVKQAEIKPDWSLYRVEFRRGNPFIVREMCDRCGKVWVPPKWRKIRTVATDVGSVFFEAGICKDCINASVYVDKYLDGEALTEKEVKEEFLRYAREYEKAWRAVIAAAPNTLLTEDEWHRRCNFFRGCAICGANIEVRAKFFPTYLNGAHTPWNVIPLCGTCNKLHLAGRQTKGKTINRYKIFSGATTFQKYKEIRVYLLNCMDKHDIYAETLIPFRKRFFETLELPEDFI